MIEGKEKLLPLDLFEKATGMHAFLEVKRKVNSINLSQAPTYLSKIRGVVGDIAGGVLGACELAFPLTVKNILADCKSDRMIFTGLGVDILTYPSAFLMTVGELVVGIYVAYLTGIDTQDVMQDRNISGGFIISKLLANAASCYLYDRYAKK